MRNRSRLMEWSASLRSTSVARGRVGRMFSIRLGRLIECQMSRATLVLRKDADHHIGRLRLRKL